MQGAQTTVFPDISIDTSTGASGAEKSESRLGRGCIISFFPQNISYNSELLRTIHHS